MPHPVFLEAGYLEGGLQDEWHGIEELQNRTLIGDWEFEAEEAIGGTRRKPGSDGAETKDAPADIIIAVKIAASHV